ncbi:MAG: hypothetical protein M1561_00265 [Gammaproteobacteria bacterium]|nr:hypothetical protein [Gammaproteobacteria bacterium]
MQSLKTKLLNFIFFFILTPNALAYDSSFAGKDSFGDIASRLFGSEMDVRLLIRVLCIMTGIALILSSIIQYGKHRRNPVETTLGAVFTSLLVGLALIALSFVPLQMQ